MLKPSFLACFPLAPGGSLAPSSPAQTFLCGCTESHRHFCQQQDAALRMLPSCQPRASPAAARVCGLLLRRGRTGAQLDAWDGVCSPVPARHPPSHIQEPAPEKQAPSLLLIF